MSLRVDQSRSIDRKLLRMSLLATSAALILASATFFANDFFTFETTLTNRLTAFADIIGYNSASSILFNDAASATHTLASLEARSSIMAAAFYTPKGDLFASWSRHPGADFPLLPSLDRDIHIIGIRSVSVFHPIIIDRQRAGFVYINSNFTERNRRITRYLFIVLGIIIISELLSAIVSIRLGRRIAEPILRLVDVARRVSSERDYHVRVHVSTDGEIGLLEGTFNDMLIQLQERGDALERANQGLEQKVIQRTEELHRKEEELYQSRRLESVGRLAGGIAHDFNNLLTGIIGCAESLESETSADSAIAVDVKEIRAAAERAAGLTRQLLAFSRKQIISPQTLDLNVQIRSTVALLQRLIGEDIQLTLELGENLGKILADAGQIDQVIMNIAVNARDAMPKGGSLRIRTSNIILGDESELLELKPGGYIMLTIADTGTGMTKEIQSQIFEPFFTTKTQGKGTGLGLSTVYGIIMQNHGAIQVHSQPALGATFKIFLPRDSSGDLSRPDESASSEENVATPGGDESILLVEDEVLVANHVARLLRKKGYDVLVAANGEEALDLMDKRGQPVDLVLTDVVMPAINGRQLVDSLRKKWPALRALYMSGYPAEVIADHGVLESGLAFIEKPFRSEQICRKIREILDSERA